MPGQKVTNSQHPYFKKQAVLTTKHQKHQILSPIFEQVLGLTVIDHEANTDVLGTFSGEVDRTLTPKQAAVQKARMGMAELGLPLGVASEGSVGLDPEMPFAVSNSELLVLVDDERQIEIFQSYRSFDIVTVKQTVLPGQNLEEILNRARFPEHKLIASANKNNNRVFSKGINSIEELEKAISKYAEISEDGLALIQSDLRAHCSPSRARNIKEAAILLANRISNQCSKCDSPGWGKVGDERGLECAQCGLMVSNALSRELFGCVKCEHTEKGPPIRKQANPANCSNCNP